MRIFLGSTKESVHLVEWASKYLADNTDVDPIPWYSSEAFPTGISALSALQGLAGELDGALIFMSAHDLTTSRGKTTSTPRDNIIFESGLFLGALGELRTFLFVQNGVRLRLPSDLQGITNESFKVIEKDPGISLAHPVRNIVKKLESLDPKDSTSDSVRQLQQQTDIHAIDAAVGDVRRILEEAVYPRIADSSVAEVDVIAAYNVADIARRLASNLQRKDFTLRVCLANMWDEDLAQIYLRKYHDRTVSDIRNTLKSSITGTLGKLKDWSEPCTGEFPIIDPESAPIARTEIYLTPQRITHAYYRIDEIICVVPLDMKKSADPPPQAWVFDRNQSPEIYDYYATHFDAVINEAERVYPKKQTNMQSEAK